MATNMQPETLLSRFKLCLIANFASIVLMFASAVVTGYVSRLYGPQPIVAETIDAGWLLSSYAIATKLSFVLEFLRSRLHLSVPEDQAVGTAVVYRIDDCPGDCRQLRLAFLTSP